MRRGPNTNIERARARHGCEALRCYNSAVNKDFVRRVVSGHKKKSASNGHLVPSAVLIPLLCKDDELHVLLTERTHAVRRHKGQVCFPGGTPEGDDDSLVDTALREAWEEVGVRPEDVEVVGEISARAEELLTNQLGYDNTSFKIGNGREGWREPAPFDRILVTAAPDTFPESLFEQLAEGGMAVAPVGNYFQQLIQYRKKKNKIVEKPLIGVTFVPLI